MMREAAIHTEDLVMEYRSGDAALRVLNHVNLTVAEGETLAIIGESGAGKSTLLHLLGGLERPKDGKIFFRDTEITGLADESLARFRNREIGFVWQIPSLLPEFTALENVMMPLLIRGEAPAKAEGFAAERLREVGLSNRAHHRAGELSGGEQQRVVLARALVGRPKVLLADEPTGNLDHRTGDKIVDLLEELHRANGLTSVIVTHNEAYAYRCDRVVRLEAGRLEGAPAGSTPAYGPTT